MFYVLNRGRHITDEQFFCTLAVFVLVALILVYLARRKKN